MKVFLIGLPGSGKSYWAKNLSKVSNIPYIDLDEVIESHAKKSIAAIFETEGEPQFRMLEHKALKRICSSSEHFILACGGGTPCYHDNLEIIKESGVSIYLKHSVDQIIKRLQNQGETAKRPLLNQEQLTEKITKLLNNRATFYDKADHIFDMDRLHQGDFLTKLKTLLSY